MRLADTEDKLLIRRLTDTENADTEDADMEDELLIWRLTDTLDADMEAADMEDGDTEADTSRCYGGW